MPPLYVLVPDAYAVAPAAESVITFDCNRNTDYSLSKGIGNRDFLTQRIGNRDHD